jgi:hypothetical protein
MKMKNWKTTLSGIASIIGGVALFFNQPDKLQEAIGMVVIGFGFLSAKDHNVTGGTMADDGIGGGGIKNPPAGTQ